MKNTECTIYITTKHGWTQQYRKEKDGWTQTGPNGVVRSLSAEPKGEGETGSGRHHGRLQFSSHYQNVAATPQPIRSPTSITRRKWSAS